MIAVIDAENQGSVAFHEKFGFQTVGILKETGYKFDRWLNSVFDAVAIGVICKGFFIYLM